MRYLKKFYFIVISVILLSSCGLVGGGDEVEVSENSVLSGPPLAIPPEFDIDGQNAQQQSSPNYDLQNSNELEETENFENIPTYQENETIVLLVNPLIPQFMAGWLDKPDSNA